MSLHVSATRCRRMQAGSGSDPRRRQLQGVPTSWPSAVGARDLDRSDTLLFCTRGAGVLALEGTTPLALRSAALVLAGESAVIDRGNGWPGAARRERRPGSEP